MGKPACTNNEFIALFQRRGAQKTADILGVDQRAVLRRRARLEKKLDIEIKAPGKGVSTAPPRILLLDI